MVESNILTENAAEQTPKPARERAGWFSLGLTPGPVFLGRLAESANLAHPALH